MKQNFVLTVILAFIWGAIWAAILQFTTFGRWLALKRTWITVVIGVAVDGLLALPLTPLSAWLRIAAIVAASSIGVIARSWINEHREDNGL